MIRSILLTGATGFVGRSTLELLMSRNLKVRATFHDRDPSLSSPLVEWRQVDLLEPGALRETTADIDVVVHCAGAAGARTQDVYNRLNVEASRRLAETAAASGVRRFVYLGSTRVYGSVPYVDEHTPVAPVDAYGLSKLRAENAIFEAAARSGMAVSVLRSPFVYGHGKGGLLSALKFASRHRLPFPTLSGSGRRSMIFVGNLCDAIIAAAAENSETSFRMPVSDGSDWIFPELYTRVSALYGVRPMAVTVPQNIAILAGRLLGRREMVMRLLQECLIDGSSFASRLAWSPPFSPEEGLRLTATGA